MSVDRTVELARARPRLLEALFPQGEDHNDAVAASGAAARMQSVPGDAAEALMRYLIHVPVNPSKEANDYILHNSYVFAQGAAPTEHDHTVVNESEEKTDALLERLVKVAKEERDRSVLGAVASEAGRRVQNGDRFFWLLGPRGAGKTFYLNHLFTSNAQSLDDRRVIWVRVNLISYRQYDRDLSGWVYAQIAKILLRYQDPASRYRTRKEAAKHPFCEDIEAWIASLPPAEKARRITGWEMMRKTFVDGDNDGDISPSTVDKAIAMELFAIARRAGWSFIVVLDGYDRLDHDRNNSGRFKVISDQLMGLMSGNAAFGAAFVVVTRTDTFKWLSAHTTWVRDNRTFEIAAASLIDVVAKRLGVVADWYRMHPIKGAQDASALALDFLGYLNTEYNRGELVELDDSLVDNVRAKLQMVEVIFKNFMQEKYHQGYRSVEYMVKAGFSYPPLLYSHRWDGDVVVSDVAEERAYDSRFLPILSRPPVPSGRGHPFADSYHLGSPLHGFRLLQLASALDRKDVQVIDLIGVLDRWFGYNQAISRALIYDYESYELLFVHRTRDTFEDADTDAITVTRKGRLALELGLSDAAYLNLCAMRTLIRHRPLPSPSYFEAATLAGRGDYVARLRHWQRVKVKNAATMAILMTAINFQQRIQFRPAARTAPYGFESDLMAAGYDSKIFAPFDGLAQTIRNSLSTITGNSLLTEAAVAALFDEIEADLAHLEAPP